MRIYIIRHADPDYENDTITPRGHLEAKALAQRMLRENIDSIYCSPLQRAQHTMNYTRELIGLPFETQDWLAEIQNWQTFDTKGRPIPAWNVDGEIIRGRMPLLTSDNFHEAEPFSNPAIRQGFAEIRSHSDRFMEEMGFRREGGRYRILKPNERKIAVFCHMGFALAWLAHLLEMPLPLLWSGFWLAPSSVTTILMDTRSEQWAVPRCLGIGDVSHLYDTKLPVSRQGIIANFY
ncbi:histidine phosphatase family protein [Paenibacillus sp. V4I5]|uniref:histidine phosphatase family protein n=1 Tax=Paenibacillus sp. V4I5 TaxID=3042306 RepID=UPI0027935619|nr:histidine phosphatase family protein [Paenibacillus sp. V4I5]MDQ0914896.1 broad specificity phosphatase PhoE [Paenibacillus sp. V4I5]